MESKDGSTKETNLIRLYMRHAGTNEVPSSFFLWSCLSMMAAAIRDSVTLNWFRGTPLATNLYIFLVGESGIGKEKAINTAVKFVSQIPKVYLYGGKVTAAALVDELSSRPIKTNGHTVESSPIYFVSEELNMSIRGGEQAQELIAFATAIYGRKPYPLKDRTRMHGMATIPMPTMNWLAGSTEEWMMRSIPRDSIEGGFFARVLAIKGEKDYSVRYPRPIYPDDYAELTEIITQRVKNLSEIEGNITVTPEAQAFHDRWYMSLVAPEDKLMRPSFNRADEMILKLAMLLSLAEWDSIAFPDEYDCMIHVHHFECAIELWESVMATLPGILRCTAANYHDKNIDVVETSLRKLKAVGHCDLAKRLTAKGLRSADVHRAVAELRDRGDVEFFCLGKAQAYRWIGD